MISIATVFSAAVFASLTDRAAASEWGCEVLLCASSSNPAWRGVPACHPPMQRLISAMGNWGFSWPTCPEAGTGKPGYEAYDECPSGWSVGSSNQDHGSGQGDLCIQVRNSCPIGYGGRDGCQETVTMARPIRQDPYYFDIRRDDGNVTRHWFNLRK
jgi:hypothetical protein